MNPKRLAFINAYLGEASGNGTKAAIAAGYNPKSASVIASQLLRREDIQAELQKRLNKHDLRTDAILKRLAKLVYSEPEKVTGTDINSAARTILQVNGALKDRQSDSRITVNIGFLTDKQPAVTVSEQEIEAEGIAVVMPPLPQLRSGNE